MTIASLLEPCQPGSPGPARFAPWLATGNAGAPRFMAGPRRWSPTPWPTRAVPRLPPLRAGQIAFVAPVGEEISLTAEIVPGRDAM